MTDAPPPITEQLLNWADRWRWALLAVVLTVYALAFNGQWRPGPDSAEHLLIADRLLRGLGFTHPTGWEYQLTPGLAYLMAAIGYPFGGVQPFLNQVVMLLIALGTLALAFVLLGEAFDRATAVLLTVMLALTETFFRLSTDLLTDMPFCLGLVMLLLGWQRLMRTGEPRDGRAKQVGHWALLIGGVMLMTLFRNVVITVLAGVVLHVLWRMVRGPRQGRMIAAGAAAIAAWCVARLAQPITVTTGQWAHDEGRVIDRLVHDLPRTLGRLLNENLPQLATENTAEALLGVDFGPVFSLLVAAAVIAVWWRLMLTNALWGWIVAAFFAQWLLFLPGDRYFLPVLLPLLVGWWQSARWLEQRWKGAWVRIAAAGMLVLWICPNLVRVVDVVHDQRRRPFLEHYAGGRFVALQELGKVIAQHADENDLVIGEDGQVLSWYSHRAVMDPKQLRLSAGLDKWQLSELLRHYPRIFMIEPYDSGPNQVMQRLPVDSGPAIASVSRGEDRPPYSLHEAELRDKFRQAPPAKPVSKRK
ncbi:MAG: hypothetical protein IT445_15450 [Phycisphaeraceae bacterium]|nr:hypothetical protein [Phycisphaeraceae bacterium]